jgi:hypothetical protein
VHVPSGYFGKGHLDVAYCVGGDDTLGGGAGADVAGDGATVRALGVLDAGAEVRVLDVPGAGVWVGVGDGDRECRRCGG